MCRALSAIRTKLRARSLTHSLSKKTVAAPCRFGILVMLSMVFLVFREMQDKNQIPFISKLPLGCINKLGRPKALDTDADWSTDTMPIGSADANVESWPSESAGAQTQPRVSNQKQAPHQADARADTFA